jgi:hypothetical protein
MSPVRRDDEKHAGARERDASDNRPRPRDLEEWDLSSDEPETSKQDQQEADFGESDARSMGKCKHSVNANDSSWGARQGRSLRGVRVTVRHA